MDRGKHRVLPPLGPRQTDAPQLLESPGVPRAARRGDIIGERYRVEGQIGRGGMGRVLEVSHCVLGKRFALKLPQRSKITSPEMRARFHREAKLASSLSHENICSVIDFGEDPEFGLFMVMDLLAGVRLDYKIRRDGRLSPKVACDVINQVAEAVRFVHGCGIIHGDIKSDNILMTRRSDRRRQVRLLDFGLARTESGTSSGKVEGTPDYLAPERIRSAPASQASDIYAMGILFWECLVGERPFQGTTMTVLEQQLHRPLPPLASRLDRPIDERADLIIARATAKRPEDRHPDVAAFLYDLRTFMSMLGHDPGRPRVDSIRGRAGNRSAEPALSPAGEVFANAPVPLAAADLRGHVRVANQAFLEFLGHASDGGGLHLAETSLIDVYPALIDDMSLASAEGMSIRQVIHVQDAEGRALSVAVILTPPQSDRGAGGEGEIHLALHPLTPRGDETWMVRGEQAGSSVTAISETMPAISETMPAIDSGPHIAPASGHEPQPASAGDGAGDEVDAESTTDPVAPLPVDEPTVPRRRP